MQFLRHCLRVAIAVLAVASPVHAQTPPVNAATAKPLRASFAPPNSKLVSATIDDAGLNAISYANEDRLCAVGDRGAMLLTENSGHSWSLLPTLTTCNLYDVAFGSEEVGIAVGGLIGTRAGISFGVVLRTVDGGKTWTLLPNEQLARLTGVAFIGNRLVAWGDYNSQLKSSLIESRDGGETWHSIPADMLGHVSAVGVNTAGAFAAIDNMGHWFDATTRMVTEILPPSARVHGLFYHAQRWWLHGDNGLCRTSSNGLDWSDVQLPLSTLARDNWQTQAMASAGQRLWMVGAPGSILLTSTDNGASWQRVPTGETMPINDILFVDANRGWIVGAQGNILATRDGGKSWFSQRRRGKRVGVLSMMPDESRIAWSPLIAAVWDKQYSVASIALASGEALERRSFLPDASSRASALAPQIGIADHSTWQLPAESREQATARAAVAVRMWRPDVLLFDERNQSASGNTASLAANPDWKRAIELAASNAELPACDELGLTAWKVSKLVAVTEAEIAEYTESNSRLLKTSGLTIWDMLLQLPVPNLPVPDLTPEGTVPMRTIWSRSQAPVTRAGLTDGIATGNEAMRAPLEHSLGNYQLVMGRVQRQQSLERMVEQPQLTNSPERWQSEFEYFVQMLPEAELGWLLIDQSQTALAAGYFDRQQALLHSLVKRRPTLDVATWAACEVLRLRSSDEFIAWRTAVDATKPSAEAALGVAVGSSGSRLAPANVASPFEQAIAASDVVKLGNQRSASEVIPAAVDATRAQEQMVTDAALRAIAVDSNAAVEANATVESAAVTESEATTESFIGTESAARGHSNAEQVRVQAWFRALDSFAQANPSLLARPDTMMLQARNLSLLGNHSGQQHQLDTLLGKPWMVGWHQAARQELFVKNERISDLKWVAFADLANQPPVLDGQLLEDCWRRVPRMRLERLAAAETDVIRQPTTIAWAYDADYLYIGLDCPRDADAVVPPAATSREYDADLSRLDHCSFILDTDRDYCTAIELSVAANGLTSDRCCGYSQYNPRWHVSVHSRSEGWSAEIAVPLDALTMNTQLTGKAWGTSARRSAPSQEMESWSQLKTHHGGLEANGLLLFVPSLQ